MFKVNEIEDIEKEEETESRVPKDDIEPTRLEVEWAIIHLKECKSPSTDVINAEPIKASGHADMNIIYQMLCKKIYKTGIVKSRTYNNTDKETFSYVQPV